MAALILWWRTCYGNPEAQALPVNNSTAGSMALQVPRDKSLLENILQMHGLAAPAFKDVRGWYIYRAYKSAENGPIYAQRSCWEAKPVTAKLEFSKALKS